VGACPNTTLIFDKNCCMNQDLHIDRTFTYISYLCIGLKITNKCENDLFEWLILDYNIMYSIIYGPQVVHIIFQVC